MTRIRPPAVAGTFYPSQQQELRTALEECFSDACLDSKGETFGQPKAMIVPHAGYIYSGPVAASAYRCLTPYAKVIQRVVLLGPCHRVPVRGLALPDADFFSTPLGAVEIDRNAVEEISGLPQVRTSSDAHAFEHSLEVQLPFLQTVLSQFRILPLVVGQASEKDVAQVLDVLWGGDETLILISSDFSHYLPYEIARDTDTKTAEGILKLQAAVDHEQACGGIPLNGLLLSAQRHRLQPVLLDLRNSGDTAGDRRQVVGYGAFAFYPETGK